MKEFRNQAFENERALYGSVDICVTDCRFEGEADGESALKECRNVCVSGCFFDLRYPFWHDEGLVVRDSELSKNCRAPFWYSRAIKIGAISFPRSSVGRSIRFV